MTVANTAVGWNRICLFSCLYWFVLLAWCLSGLFVVSESDVVTSYWVIRPPDGNLHNFQYKVEINHHAARPPDMTLSHSHEVME